MDAFALAFKNIRRRKVRSFLTILGIAIGILSVLVVNCISENGKSAINAELDNLGLNGLLINSDKLDELPLNEKDLQAVSAQPEIQNATPIIMETSGVSTKTQTLESVLWGVDEGANQVISMELLHGRFLNAGDVRASAKVCMIDSSLAEQMYQRTNIVGKSISVKIDNANYPVEVVGVVRADSGILQNVISDYMPSFLYMPYTTVQEATYRDEIDKIAVKVKGGSDASEVGNTLVERMNHTIKVENLAQQRDRLGNMVDIVSLVLSIVGTISLVVAGLGIMTMMLTSVNERTREIGIKKSIGAAKSNIMLEFFAESVLISVLGCLLGVSAGLLLILAAGWLLHMNLLLISVSTTIQIVVISIVLGVVFCVYPAYKASTLRPIEALRCD